MSPDPDNRRESEGPSYRVYRGGARSAGGGGGGRGSGAGGGGRLAGASQRERPYRTYRSSPRGLAARLRGEDDVLVPGAERSRGGNGGRGRDQDQGKRSFSWKRFVGILVAALCGWLLLSLVLFLISAQTHSGNLPNGAQAALTSGGPMLTSANNVLILGLDNRPKKGSGSKEPGANTNEAFAHTDTIMLWRIGGGVSRRLSIPRDTLVNIPGHGESKINAAWTYGGPALAVKVIKQFTGLQINHLIVVDLANFPQFINDVGGVSIKTGRICSNISGGAAKGGYTLNLRPGVHHLTGLQTLVLARTRENSCNPASNDLTREAVQQQILNSIKSQLLTFHTFLHLPWAAWDAPGVVQTDMGGLTMLQLFAAAEMGGSAPPKLLKESAGTYNGQDVLIPNQGNVRSSVRKLLNG